MAAESPLFHYTSQAGLLGILEGNCLWATVAEFLNDKSEYSHGLALIEQSLARRCNQIEDEMERLKMNLLRRALRKLPRVCVASFSEEGDLLSQWRAYGGGSGGFALGFRREHLRTVGEGQRFYLEKCIYSQKDQAKAIEELMDAWYERIKQDKSMIGCAKQASRLAVRLKPESFEEEREWRLIGIPKTVSELHFRQGKSMLIPYFKLGLGHATAYLEGVVVGPNPHGDLGDHAVSLFLRKLNLPNPDLMTKRTRIPYRNW